MLNLRKENTEKKKEIIKEMKRVKRKEEKEGKKESSERDLLLTGSANTHLVLTLVHNFLQQLEEPGKSNARSLTRTHGSDDRLSRGTLQTTLSVRKMNKQGEHSSHGEGN